MRTERKLNVSGIGGMGWLFTAVLLILLAYDAEIRCALGNQIECAKMHVEPKR